MLIELCYKLYLEIEIPNMHSFIFHFYFNLLSRMTSFVVVYSSIARDHLWVQTIYI